MLVWLSPMPRPGRLMWALEGGRLPRGLVCPFVPESHSQVLCPELGCSQHLLFVIGDWISCGPGRPQTHNVAEDDSEFLLSLARVGYLQDLHFFFRESKYKLTQIYRNITETTLMAKQ